MGVKPSFAMLCNASLCAPAEDILKQANFDVLCLQEVEKTDADSMLDMNKAL